jgi:hypothetical protein
MASESLAAGISAVVSAVVTTVVGVLIQWGKRASDFLARTFRPDHSALFEGLLLLTGSGK